MCDKEAELLSELAETSTIRINSSTHLAVGSGVDGSPVLCCIALQDRVSDLQCAVVAAAETTAECRCVSLHCAVRNTEAAAV
jgi:hypothetical protein